MTFDVLGLGCTTVDDFLYVESYPAPDTKTRISIRDRQTLFDELPESIKQLAHRNCRLLRINPSHPSLQFRPIAEGRFLSVRIGLHYRALGVPVPGGVQWFWIGTHAQYDYTSDRYGQISTARLKGLQLFLRLLVAGIDL